MNKNDLSPRQLAAIDAAADLRRQTEEIKNEPAVPVSAPLVAPSLEDELDAMLDQIPEQVLEEEEAPVTLQEEIRGDVLQLLKDREDAPSDDQIVMWKEQYGEEAIQLIGLDKSNVYVYTHLTLSQWEKINEIVAKAQGTPMESQINNMLREKTIRTCVLWPELAPNFFKVCKAGLPDTLYQLIMIQSYFLSPQQAMTLTTQL